MRNGTGRRCNKEMDRGAARHDTGNRNGKSRKAQTAARGALTVPNFPAFRSAAEHQAALTGINRATGRGAANSPPAACPPAIAAAQEEMKIKEEQRRTSMNMD